MGINIDTQTTRATKSLIVLVIIYDQEKSKKYKINWMIYFNTS